jgi:hypothetical protein
MSKAAMQQALEALEETTALCINFEDYEFTEARTVIPMGNAAIEALKAALADQQSLSRDAERYRYLRDRSPNEVLTLIGTHAGCWIDCESDSGTLTLLTGEDADAAIDAAIAAGART